MKKGKYREAVFVVVYEKGKEGVKYLLFKRKKHWKGWEFCKGGIDKKESQRKTALREVKEESGLKVLNIKKYKKSGKYLYQKLLKDRPGIIGQTYSLYSAEVGKGKVKLDKEHKEHSSYKWVSFEKAIEMLEWPNQRACLRIVNRNI